MKYIILLYGPESGDGYEELSTEAFEAAMQHHRDFATWCDENNVAITSSLALKKSDTATNVDPAGVVTDGPYLELKEQLGGYYQIETDSGELAKEAARRCPNYGANELRPLVDHG